MKKIKTLKRFYVLAFLLCFGISQGWGTSKTYYGKVTARSNGNGTVYVSTSDETPSDDKFDEVSEAKSSNTSTGNSASVTFHLFAKPESDDYDFTGWSGSGTSSDDHFTVSFNANSQDANDPTAREYAATFTHKVDYTATMKAEVVGEGGYVQITGGDKSSGDPAATATLVQDGYSAKNIIYNFTLKATPKDGYQFAGWRTSATATNNASTAASYNRPLTCTVENPDQVGNYYAHFQKIYYSKVTLVSPVSEFGTVNVSLNTTAGTYGATSTISKDGTSPSHNYYPKTQAAEGYTFEGWYDNPEFTGSKLSVNQDWNRAFTVDASSSTYGHPVEKTYYARFTKNSVAADTYLRNRETGRFLMNGGTNSTHAVVGNYAKMGVELVDVADGKKVIFTPYGTLSANATVDGAATAWTMEQNAEGFYTISCNGNALTTADDKYFNDAPLYCYVTTAALDANDKHQQWEKVTLEQLNAEIAKATPENPVNVSHLIKNPNFDKVDGRGGWVFDRSDVIGISLSTDHGTGGEDGDDCNYNRWISKTASGDAWWKLNQKLADIPNGYYIVTCQGFVNSDHNNNFFRGNEDSGNWSGVGVNLKKHDSETPSASNTHASAMDAFNKGLYQNIIPTPVHVANGKLEIGVETKDDRNAGNTFLDNFQLYYLGTENPNREYTVYDVIGSARKATVDGHKVTLTGTWREVDMKAVSAGPATGDLSGDINDGILVVDASKNATLIAKPEIPTKAPNAIIYAKEGVANTKNVVIVGGEGNTCENFVLTDKEPVLIPTEFNAKEASYTRESTSEWGTIILPFVPENSGYTFYALESVGENTLEFGKVDEDALQANTPYLYRNEGGNNLKMNVGNVVVKDAKNTPNVFTAENVGDTGMNMIGVYERTTVFASTEHKNYNTTTNNKVVDANTYYIKADGSSFARINGSFNLNPFRAYLSAGNTNAKPAMFSFVINENEVDGINASFEDNDEIVGYYNTNGVQQNDMQKGVNIIKFKSGKTLKVIIK